jgi:hypothetical protein
VQKPCHLVAWPTFSVPLDQWPIKAHGMDILEALNCEVEPLVD